MKVHERVRSIRESKGITQAHVARKLGVTYQAYHAKENGRTKFTAEALMQVANILDEPIENFFDKELYESKKNNQEAI